MGQIYTWEAGEIVLEQGMILDSVSLTTVPIGREKADAEKATIKYKMCI